MMGGVTAETGQSRLRKTNTTILPEAAGEIKLSSVKIEGIVLTEGEFEATRLTKKIAPTRKKICPEYRDASTHRNFQTYTLTGILGLTASAVIRFWLPAHLSSMRETKEGARRTPWVEARSLLEIEP